MTWRMRDETGATLLEAMIAIAILTVGMLGLMQLQIMGIYSNQGARANTTAAQLGRELLSGLEALPTGSPLLDATTPFGPLLESDGSATSGAKDTGTYPVSGVRLDATLDRDPENGAVSIYRRRWTVQDAGPPGAESSVRRLAVSVIWRERGLSRPRELVLYGSRSNPGLVLSNAAAYR
jgi:Tfp pilus assembly protein PilV